MRKIIVIGETGSGKSSLINMIVGRDVAKTSDAAIGCTFQADKYEDDSGDCYFDTAGLNEAAKGTVSAKEAISSLVKLLQQLESGVNLIIFVIKKGRISETMVKNYAIFVSGICQEKVPVVLAISGCEMDDENDAWFKENKAYFYTNGLKFVEIVSGCFTKNVDKVKPAFRQAYLDSYEESKKRMKNILLVDKYSVAHTFGNLLEWLKTSLKMIWNIIAKVLRLPPASLWDSLKSALMKFLDLGESEAIALANQLAIR